MSDDEDNTPISRRGFIRLTGRRMAAVATGGLIGAGVGAVCIDPNDTPDDEKRKVVGGAVVGAAVVATADHVRGRNPEAEEREAHRHFEKKRSWRFWQDRMEDRHDPKDKHRH